MIHWIQDKYNVKLVGDGKERSEIEKLRKEVAVYRKKYGKIDKEMEVSSESDSEVDEEEQKRIDEEMKKRQQKAQVEVVLL